MKRKSFIWGSSPPDWLRIRKNKKPQEGYPLSGVALVQTLSTARYSNPKVNIKFDNSLVEKLGKVLPMGLGWAHPVYLRVEEKFGIYEIYAVYIDEDIEVGLWVQDGPPPWCK